VCLFSLSTFTFFFQLQMVLSACSTYFKQLFLEHAEPPVTGPMIVIMRETSFDDLAIIVEFMYKGEINVSQVRFFWKNEKFLKMQK
jgi:hypothetical protein